MLAGTLSRPGIARREIRYGVLAMVRAISKTLPLAILTPLMRYLSMRSRALKALGLSLLSVLAVTMVIIPAIPVQAKTCFTCEDLEPIWASLNSSGTANYRGGDELFTVFVVNSAPNIADNETLTNISINTTPAFASNFAIGLPELLQPGYGQLFPIYLEIPNNFTQPSFIANVIINATLLNGTTTSPLNLTGHATVDVLAVPSNSSSISGSSSGATVTSTVMVTTTSSGSSSSGVSNSLFAIGVATPSIIAIILLVLVVQMRGRTRRITPSTPAQGP
jgi:hypothetical protein